MSSDGEEEEAHDRYDVEPAHLRHDERSDIQEEIDGRLWGDESEPEQRHQQSGRCEEDRWADGRFVGDQES